jgi:uncharacterized membrane protein YphA (DoxX/SURF4 family)
MKTKVTGYWATTIPLALESLVGGEWDLTHRPYAVQMVTHLGYPAYFLTILGFWKLLAGIALLAPGFARLKEWAYAGVFFAMTGAAASHAARGDNSGLIVPLSFAALTVASWALRPQSRILGALFPAKAKA